ncbi:ribonuclease E/G [Acetobacteraceae bacterium ESL0709]|nr:ribonuclease E/G [Acetobacteraceae bacterium ESL0697]MDF7678997.1 ribonuclease E/G [Acetobacteraceae bacterium ESL0709]
MIILLSGSPGELRFTLMKGNDIQDIALWRPGMPDGWGDQYLVRVLSWAPAFDGAFVQLENRQDGFLVTKTILQEGQLVKAQIVRCAQKNKGPRLKLLTATPDKSAEHIGILQAGPLPLEDLLAQAPQASVGYEDASLAAQLPTKYQSLLKRLTHEHFSFLETEWATFLETTINVGPLIAHIVPTPALTAIDLDAPCMPDFAANVEALQALVHQIRLRNLSGTILIDPAGIRTRKRAALVPFLERSLQQERDPLCPRISGLTPSGLIEITRPAKRPPLSEAFSSPHGRGLTILRQILREELPGTTLHAPASIIQALDSDPQALTSFNRVRGKKLQLSIRPPHSSLSWSLT